MSSLVAFPTTNGRPNNWLQKTHDQLLRSEEQKMVMGFLYSVQQSWVNCVNPSWVDDILAESERAAAAQQQHGHTDERAQRNNDAQ